MAASLKVKKLRGGVYWGLEESSRNVTGTPIISVAKSGTGNQRAGIYVLTFTNVVPGTSATCHVACADPHNPSRDAVGKPVLLDGTTVHKTIIEGLQLVFSASLSFNSGWEGRVYYGAFYDTNDSTEQSVLNEGTVEAGTTVGTDRLVVENEGSDLAASCSVRVVNGVRFVNDAGTAIKSIAYTEVNLIANLGGYAITYDNFVDASPDTIDVLVDGLTYDIKRIDTGVSFPGGAGVPMDGVTVLEWTAGPLAGLRFVLDTSTDVTDESTIYVSDGARLVEIAPDVGGSPGTWQAGTTPLTITQDGGAVIGEIAAGTRAFFHERIKSLSTDSPVGNQRHFRNVTRGLGV